MEVGTVSIQEVPTMWPQVFGYIQSGLPKEIMLFDMDDVKANLDSGNWILAVAMENGRVDGAVVLGIDTYPKCRAVSIISLGGKDGKHWFDAMSDLIENIRKNTGSNYTIFSGREGWQRVRPEFHKTASVYYRGEA